MLRSPVFLGGQSVSMLGDGLAILAIPLTVLQLSRSPLLAVPASLPGGAGYLAAGLPVGVLADRLDPWQLLIATDVPRTLIFLALILLLSVAALTLPTVGVAWLTGLRKEGGSAAAVSLPGSQGQ